MLDNRRERTLEAILLSTFVMIGQYRQAGFQRAKPDHDFTFGEQELRRNTQLTEEIHTLTAALHRHVIGDAVETGQPESDLEDTANGGRLAPGGGHRPLMRIAAGSATVGTREVLPFWRGALGSLAWVWCESSASIHRIGAKRA